MKMAKRHPPKVLFFYEGETEKQLIQALKEINKQQDGSILLGKAQKFDLWKNDIKKLMPRIKEDELIFICDTDVLDSCIAQFEKNLTLLKKNKTKFSLLIQVKNMEDEILNCTACKKLDEFFATKGTDNFKNAWIKCGKANKLSQKLLSVAIDTDKLWTQALPNELSRLNQWIEFRVGFTDLPRVNQ